MGTTIFLPLDTPDSGGDTLYLSTVAAYNALSPGFREFLHGKSATHSGFSQAAVHENRERYIREPIETVHPVVRTHPVRSFWDPRASKENSETYLTPSRRSPRPIRCTSIDCTRAGFWI